MKRTCIISFCLIGILTSFQTHQGLLLTFKNSTSEDFERLEVYTKKGFQIFYNLRKGESTRAISVSESYQFSYAKAITSIDTIVTPGYCRLGEKSFSDGNMVMEFGIKTEKNEKRYLTIKTVIKSSTDSTSLDF